MKRFGLAALVGLIAIVLSGCGPVAQPTSSAAGATVGASNGTTSTATPGGATFGPSSATPGSSPAAGGAHGWLIAYIKGGDVFVVNADGGNATQLTSDGANGAYTDPSFAPDGSIYVIRNRNQLVHIDLSGHVIGAPVALTVLENGGEGLSVAPDGAHMAYVTTGFGTYVDPRFGTPNGAFIYGGADVIGPDGASVPGAAMPQMIYPSWAAPGSLVVTDGTAIYTDSVGSAPVKWLDASDGCLIPSDCPSGQEAAANLTRPVISSDGTVLAYQHQPYYGTAGRRMASVAGSGAASTAEPRCLVEGQENFSDAGSLSSDGTLFAFDDSQFDPVSLETTAGSGVWVMTVDLNSPDCGAASARLVGPGGLTPDLSPMLP